MLVSEIKEVADTDSEATFDLPMSQVALRDNLVYINNDEYSLDETTLRSLGSLLDISPVYLKKCPPELAAQNINYWLRQKEDQDAVVHMVSGHPRFLKSGMKFVPLRPLVEMIERVFDPSDEVVEFRTNDQVTHIDVISNEHRIEVPGRDVPLRPDNDVTHGGMRFRVTSDLRAKPPELYTYLNRRVCTNGMCIADSQFKLTLHGNTVDDVLREMEETAQQLMGKLPETLMTYRQTADQEIPGEVAQFVHTVAAEHKIGMRVTNAALNRLGELPNPASLYDVIQLFTNIANDDVTYRTRDNLQFLGGAMAANPDMYTHRCQSCQHLL